MGKIKQSKEIANKLSKKYFKETADSYDLSRVKDFREVELLKKEFNIIKEFTTDRKAKLLDVACGTGIYFPHYLNKKIYGIDISKDMLKHAKKKRQSIILRVADASKLPYRNSTFDFVITSRFICHHPEWESVIREMTRVLKKNGFLIIDFPNKLSISAITTYTRLLLGKLAHYNLFSWGDIKKIAQRHHLKIISIKSKVFIPLRSLPIGMYPLVRIINNKMSFLFPTLSTPMYVKFKKTG